MNIVANLDIYTVIGNGKNGATILDLIVTIIGFVIFLIVYLLPIKNKNLHNLINFCVMFILLLIRIITNIYRLPLSYILFSTGICLFGLMIVFYRIYMEEIRGKRENKK